MNLTLLKFDVLRVAPYWLACAGAVLLAVLTEQAPLSTWGGWIAPAGAVLGIVSGWRLFADPPSTRAYLFTRGLSRSRIFWNRWLLGFAGIVLVTGLATATIVLGARDVCHRALGYEDAIYYPMIRRFELRCLPALFGMAALGYGVTIFAVVWRSLVTSKRGSSLGSAVRRMRDFAALSLSVLATLLIVEYLADDIGIEKLVWPFVSIWSSPAWQLAYLTICPLLMTVAAAHAWKHQEIPA